MVCTTGNWFSNFENTTSNGPCGYISSFQEVVLSQVNNSNATGGLLAAGQTLLNNPNGAFGLMGFALNNNANSTGGAWSGYFECDQTVNNTHSGCLGIEIDDGNFVSDAQAGSPDPFTQTDIVDMHLACGSGVSSPTSFKCGAAMQIVNNSQPFKVGISFLTGGIASSVGTLGTFNNAIEMPAGYAILWYSSAGTQVGAIQVDGSGNVNIAGAGSLKYNGTTITVP